MLGKFFLALFLLIKILTSATTTTATTTTVQPHTVNNTSMQFIDFFKLSNNSLRAGFEPFYYITNLFIDSLFNPNIPHCKRFLNVIFMFLLLFLKTKKISFFICFNFGKDESIVQENKSPIYSITQVFYKGFDLETNTPGQIMATVKSIFFKLSSQS